jgi:hypothetical protein
MKKLIALVLILLSTSVYAEYFSKEDAIKSALQIAEQENKTLIDKSESQDYQKIIDRIQIKENDLEIGGLRQERLKIHRRTFLFLTKEQDLLIFVYKNIDSTLTYWIFGTP